MKKSMKKKGFTLVEIMIVVAIIGLLAAIGIPSFSKARASSIDKAKSNNLRLVVSAADQYAMEKSIASGDIAYADYCAYLKGCTAEDSTALDVGKGVFQKTAVTLGDADAPAVYTTMPE